MKVHVMGLVLCCVSVGAFLVQTQPLHQSAPDQQSLQILTKTLLSLTNHSAVVKEICRAYPTLIIPHPGECQLYYNCSLTYTSVPAHLEQHMVECDYPELFSEKTSQCENFTDVCCGARKEIKNKCSYRHEKANEYCNYQSCIDFPDGLIQVLVSVHYKVCFKERNVGEGSCKLWFELPYNGKCTSRLEIPISKFEGLMPSCTGKADGIYRFDHSSALQHVMDFGDYFHIGRVCDAYYKCKGGTITIVKCKNGTVFHMDSGTCKPGNSSLPNSCQLYCNPQKKNVNPFPINLAECPYPLQFSETTGRCENFTEVNCGTRKEEKYICSYWESLYFNRHGGKCDNWNVRDCLYLPNGIHPHPRRSPLSFIRCYGNRLVEEGNCTIDSVWGTQTFPYNGTCTQRFAIPSSEAPYGLLPNCSAKPDGNYQFIRRPCDAYYRCEGGRATAVKCPEHTYFDVTKRTCASNVACYRAR